MDAFFASVEQRDQPSLRNKPVIVGGSPNSRGVVAACSYEARRFGISSAMSSKRAYQLCPHAVFIPPRIEIYREVSNQIMAIFRHYTDLVEPVSFDEAYLDVTWNYLGETSATIVADKVKKEIFANTQLSCSAGVSYNKFIAKVASSYSKPDGLTVVSPTQAQVFLDGIAVRKFFGVGKVTQARLNQMGVQTGLDLRKLTIDQLSDAFADKGKLLYALARGIDPRVVEPNRVIKSVGKEKTFAHDLEKEQDIQLVFEDLTIGLQERLLEKELLTKVIVLKVKFEDFCQVTKQVSTPKPLQLAEDILPYVKSLWTQIGNSGKKVRLLGVSGHALIKKAYLCEQLSMF